MMLFVAACFLVACTDSDTDGGEGGDPTSTSTTPKAQTKILITVGDKDTTTEYTVDYDQPLTIRPYAPEHYTFVQYSFFAPNGETYYSNATGDQWSTSNVKGGKTEVLFWRWEEQEIRVKATLAPMSYKIKYCSGIEGDTTTYDLSVPEVTLNGEFSEDFAEKLGKALYDLCSPRSAGYTFAGVSSLRLSDGAMNRIMETVSVTQSGAYSLRFDPPSAQTLNATDYYLDDAKRECVFRAMWKKGTYTLTFRGWKVANDGTDFLDLFATVPVEYGETIRLSQQFDHAKLLKEGSVHIGWTTKENTAQTCFSTDAEYSASASFINEDTAKTNIDLYAVWGKTPELPSKENCKIEGLKVIVTPTDIARETVSYRYTTAETGEWKTLPDGDLSKLDKGRIYTVTADIVRYYTTDLERVEARVSLLDLFCEKVQPVDDPEVSVIMRGDSRDTVSVSTTEKEKVTIVLDGEVLGTLEDLEKENKYFLCDLTGGAHSLRAYVSFIENDILYQSVFGEECSFNVRRGTCYINYKMDGLFLGVQDLESLDGSVENYITARIIANYDGTKENPPVDWDEYSNFSNYMNSLMGKSSNIKEGGYIRCEVTLHGNENLVTSVLHAEIRRTNGVLVVKTEGADGSIVESIIEDNK